MQQYYTLEQAAQILRINPDQLKEMARKKEIRAFQDRSGWRFRAQEIDELARSKGYGSDPELPLGEAAKGKAGDSGNEVFNFSLGADDSDDVGLGKEPTRSGMRKTSSSKSPPPKASSDSDVRLVLEGGDVNFAVDSGTSKGPGSKAPVSPPPKVGSSSKTRKGPPIQDDSGVRIVPLDQPSDSDVKIVPASPPHDSDVPAASKHPAKKKSDSDIRIEELHRGGKADQMVTEEIDLDAEQRKAEAAQAKATRHRPKPGSSPVLPTTSPFELSESDLDITRPAASAAPAGEQADSDTDSSSDFELKPMTDSSSPLELGSDEIPVRMGDDEVNLGEMTGGKGASGISLQDPADSGISLEPEPSGELEATTASSRTPQPTPASKPELDSSSDFELNVEEGGSSSTDSSSDFELSLQDDDASSSEGSSEFELSLDAEGSDLAVEEGSSDLVMETPGSDSDSEFELTLDDSGGLSVEQGAASSSGSNVFETDFEVPSLGEESGAGSSSEAVALEESDTDLGSSEFDISVEDGESGSQVVPLEDEEDYDEGAATVQRKAKTRGARTPGEESLDDLGEELHEDLDEAPGEEEEVSPVVATAPAPPADWGVMVPVVSLVSTIILFLVMLMSFELMQGMWGYHTGNKVSNLLIHPIAKMFSGDDKLPEN
ncbi:MAG TPA: helix-turn-helix domain-containing protein [Gemmataceae bacterium]|nr:helix-turn-helix domain-containing protein [Gemmataceae bacterium]